MYRIWKRFDFSASHQLAGLTPEHQCARLHGHNYSVEVELKAEKLDSVGFVLDYNALKAFKNWIDTTLDHRHLNDVFTFNPTAENMAEALYHLASSMFGGLVSAVRVSETPKTVAEYTP